MNKSLSLAAVFFNGLTARELLEEKIHTILFNNFEINWEFDGDSYDSSFEINIFDEVPEDFAPTSEQVNKILELGCNHFWINFYKNNKKFAEYSCSPSNISLKYY